MSYSVKSLEPNPIKHANCFSKKIYGWVIRNVFIKRTKRELYIHDLYQPLPSQESALLGNNLENYWQNEVARAEKRKTKPNLFLALFKVFFCSFIFSGIPLLIYNILSVVQPIFLAELLKILANNNRSTDDEKYIYGGIIVIFTIAKILAFHQYIASAFILGMKIRVACCSLVYQKMLRISSSAMSKITAGHLINLVSNDVSRFDFGLLFLVCIWTTPIQLLVGIYIIWYEAGLYSLSGLAVMALISLPIQGCLGKLSSKYRLRVAQRTDTRVKHMNEIINGIQVIKMYAWEKPFEKLIEAKRKHEISTIKKSGILKAICVTFYMLTDKACLFVTIICYTLLGYNVTSAMVFSLAQFFNVMQTSMIQGFFAAVFYGAEMIVGIRRINDYLLLDENPVNKSQLEDNIRNSAVVLENVDAFWDINSDWRLKNININIHPGSLCTIIGSVGSGKSSVLNLIIKELLPTSGTVKIGGNISYASQEPWLFAESVKENILFGNPYDKDKYKEVVRVCALEKDYKRFPYGDSTIVGERGVVLSGGQRARINLARAVYRQTDIYIFDDPLSAVDAHVSKHLFDECISGYLKNKTRILVTHQLQFLKRADLIVVLHEGQIVTQGTYNELIQSNTDINKFLHVESNQEEETTKKSEYTHQETSILDTSIMSETTDKAKIIEEEISSSHPLFWPYFRAAKNNGLLFFVAVLFIAAQVALNSSDLLLTYWLDAKISKASVTLMTVGDEIDEIIVIYKNNTFSSDNENSSTYTYYMTPKNHTEVRQEESFVRRYGLYVYGVLMIITVILMFMRSILFIMLCMNSSVKLHNTTFHCLLKTTMRFFDTNPSGRILNRFANDMGTMDEIIPRMMLETLQIIFCMAGSLIVILITNVFMVIPMVLLAIVVYKFTVLYTKTVTNIKRIESITRSPIYSYVKTSYDGLAVIRSFNSQGNCKKEFHNLQDMNTAAWYLTIATRVAYGLWLDLCLAMLISAVIFTCIYLNEVSDIFSDSKAGLAISQALIITATFQIGTKYATDIINYMISVERILQYTKLDKEISLNTAQTDEIKHSWPSLGTIEFKNIYLRYALNEPPVLKNINFLITPGQKVGVVGRTGAGKSSLISALFRLSPIEGNIFIDMIDTTNIELNILRSKISIIPQRPVLFSASIRYNLDPFNEYEDDAIWNALEEVEMKDSIPKLEYVVQEEGTNFSVGQRQLLCLARAILRNNNILILDEATANIDQQTDALIQRTIRRKFERCTILTIAHRLNTIMDSDLVLVMHAGEVVEIDHPYILLQNSNGYFSKLVADHEECAAKNLKKLAYEEYLQKIHDVVTEL